MESEEEILSAAYDKDICPCCENGLNWDENYIGEFISGGKCRYTKYECNNCFSIWFYGRDKSEIEVNNFKGNRMSEPTHKKSPWRVGKGHCIVSDHPVVGMPGSDQFPTSNLALQDGEG